MKKNDVRMGKIEESEDQKFKDRKVKGNLQEYLLWMLPGASRYHLININVYQRHCKFDLLWLCESSKP